MEYVLIFVETCFNLKTHVMNLNNYTIKSQEAIQQAVQITTENGQQTIENAHILKGILQVDENVIPFILKKLNVNTQMFTQTLDKIIEKDTEILNLFLNGQPEGYEELPEYEKHVVFP